jgi:uncharacterized membrane protein
MMLNRVLTVAALAVGGMVLSKQLKKNRASGAGSSVIEAIDVKVPVSTAYNQWTQFEEFPRFMDNVHEVRQRDDKHLHWRADVAGKEKEWDVEITEQIPDQRIAWRSMSGPYNAGVATFHRVSEDSCRVTLQMDYEPETLAEKAGDMLGAMRMQVRSDLKRFKEMLESRGHETGAWRGTITH